MARIRGFPTTTRKQRAVSTIQRKRRANRQRRRRGRHAGPSGLKTVLKSVYQVVSALPILPAPIRTAADWIARQFGLTTATINAPSFVMTDGVINTLEWSGFVRSELFISGDPKAGSYNEHTMTITTNIRTIRPISIRFELSPQNPMTNRSGYYTMGFIPATGPDSYDEFKTLDKEQLGYERFLQRVPVKARFPGTGKGTMTYNVPASNVFLHNGIPLRKVGDTTSVDTIGFLIVLYKRDDRVEYSNFTSDEVSFDLRITGTCVPMLVDPVTPQEVFAARIIKDYNSGGAYCFRNPTTKECVQLRTATWNPRNKMFEAQDKDKVSYSLEVTDLEQMAIQ